jgi:hypothetical protein
VQQRAERLRISARIGLMQRDFERAQGGEEFFVCY